MGRSKHGSLFFFLFIFYSANQLCQLCGKWFKMDTRDVFYLQHCLLSLPGTKNPASTGSDEFYMYSGFGLNIKRTGHGQQSPPPPRDNNNIKGWKKEEKSEGKTSRCPHTLTDSWSLGSAAQTLCRSDVGQTQRQISWNKKTPVPHHLQMIMAGKTPFQNNDSGRRDEKRKSSLLYLQRWQRVCDVRDVKAHYCTRSVMEDCLLIWLFVFMRMIRHPCCIYFFVVRGKAAVFGSLAARSVCVCVCVYSTRTRLGLLGGCTCNAALLLCWSQLKGCS